MALPHSRYLIEAFDRSPDYAEILVLGPARRSEAAAVFQVEGAPAKPLAKTRFVPVRTSGLRETICTFGEWRRHIAEFNPDIVIVLDEALSANVLGAAIANRAVGHAKVFFYGFENIVQGNGWHRVMEEPSSQVVWDWLRKSFRYVLLDHAAMPLRRQLVSGGLVSYGECANVVRAMHWSPPMIEQWWGVNDAVFTPEGPKADLGIKARYAAGFVGRFVQEKGIVGLVETIAGLGLDYGLVLIGEGPLKLILEARAGGMGLRDRVRFVAPLNQNDLAAYLRTLDVLVLPSVATPTWKEQFGRVLAEAMLCGTPVIGSRSGAIPFVIGEPSLTFPEHDRLAMSRVIEAVCRRRPPGDALARRGKLAASDRFVRAWIDLAKMSGVGH